MILHPDGRIEGTPEEVAEYMRKKDPMFGKVNMPLTEEPTSIEKVPGSIILMSTEEKQKVINESANVLKSQMNKGMTVEQAGAAIKNMYKEMDK
ncbi:hypothetical protein NST28_29120 [Paenibacillus sp. FSL R10-2791]|uniref:hypothetical protein n=1 Tax=Paenibacillus sp. FSL R10-2791 TaxID=2954695 RepID=UPI0030FC9037